MPTPRLTTTSYALLGHLAMRPFTMYDLAKQMRRNVRYFHSAAESRVYEEAKRLARLGLATAADESTGRRPRTVYTITDAGRDALEAWLASPAERAPRVEFEGLLRVIFGAFGDDESLRGAIESARLTSDDIFEVGERVIDEYLTGTAPFQEYVVHRAFLHDFLWNFAAFLEGWVERSLDRFERWPDLSAEERLAEALDVYRSFPIPAR